jgi:murein L,D-transpeptidase YcbB/YkuD
MEKLKFILFSIIVLVLLGLIGYWAISTLSSGTEFATSQKIQQLQKENNDLTKQVADLTEKLDTFSQSQPENPNLATQDSASESVPVFSAPIPTKVTIYKNQSLIDDLQNLITNNVSMKLKSSGTRVGTVQKFLNIYNNTSNKIDNDYGLSTQKAIIAFQKDQGLNADGQVSSDTFSKMIDWLKKQG